METPRRTIAEIHESLLNRQRRQMVEQIDECSAYDVWSDYAEYLLQIYNNAVTELRYFTDATISYHRIKSD